MRSLAIPFDIPDGWVWIHPTDIGYFGSGKTPTPDQLSKFGTVPYFKVADMNAAGNEIVLCNSNSFLKFPDSMKLFSKGAVVYPKNGGAVFTNKKRILGQDSLVDLNTGSYTPFSQMDEKFFYYLFSTVDFQKYYKGTALPTVDMDAVQEIVWALPPLAEQKRIVTAIELSLPLIDKYEETHSQLSRLQNSFPEALKKSILQEAVQGKLVPQDPSDEPAEALLGRIRAEKQRLIKEGKIKKDKHESVIFRRDNSHYEKRGSEEVCIDEELPFEIPSGWSWSRLGTCLDVRDGTHDTPRYVSEGVPLVTSKNLSNGRIDFSTAKLISREDSQAINQRSKVDSGDIMYAMIGSIGNPVLYQGTDEFSIKNMALFKNIPAGMYMEYVYWFLVLAQEDMRKAASGGVQAFVSLGYLRNYLIPVPPIAEQKRICDTIKQTLPLLAAL